MEERKRTAGKGAKWGAIIVFISITAFSESLEAEI